MNYFTFIKNGISYDSRNYPDLIVSELPPITTPPKRHEIIYIDGVDGGMVQEKGYGTYEKTMLISLRRAIDIDDITFLLSGSGEIEVFKRIRKIISCNNPKPNRLYQAGAISYCVGCLFGSTS